MRISIGNIFTEYFLIESLLLAHFIPTIIERLNRPDVKQLHLLHRLDKQSTGVLLMA